MKLELTVMKKVKLFLLVLLVALLIHISCSKDDISPIQQLEINLVVLNEDGEKSNTLRVGTDFYIGLELVNNSADTIFFSSDDYRRLFTQFYEREDFLLVYELTPEGTVPVGKPYDPEINLNFLDINAPPTKIFPTRGRVLFSFNWLYHQDNMPLNYGKYYSSYKDKAVIENIEKDINTSVEFIVN